MPPGDARNKLHVGAGRARENLPYPIADRVLSVSTGVFPERREESGEDTPGFQAGRRGAARAAQSLANRLGFGRGEQTASGSLS